MHCISYSQSSDIERNGLACYSQTSFQSDFTMLHNNLSIEIEHMSQQAEETFKIIRPLPMRSLSKIDATPNQSMPDLLSRRFSSQIFNDAQSQQSSNSFKADNDVNSLHDNEIMDDDEYDSLDNYSRKEKSLGKLCCKFLQKCCKSVDFTINLDNMTDELGVERRRMYDIINILETLNGVKRKAKSLYEWCGFDAIIESLDQISRNEFKAEFLSSKKQKSLTLLTFYFIQLFYNYKQVISLDEAAQKINANIPNLTNLKTRIRRLYDISNVLCSINLIDKINNESNKPSLKWLGKKGLMIFERDLFENKPILQDKKENIGTVKKSLTKIDAKEAKKVLTSSTKNQGKHLFRELFKVSNGNMLILKPPKLTNFDEDFYLKNKISSFDNLFDIIGHEFITIYCTTI